MTLTEVAARTDLTRATARRFLYTLVELGYVRTDGKTFALTAKVLQLGYAYLSGLSLPQLAQPHLEELSLQLGESTSAAVLDGTDIAYVARVDHPPDHERRHHRGHPVPGLRHLHGPRPARRASAGRAAGSTSRRPRSSPLTPRAIGTREDAAGRAGHRPRAGLVPAGPGTRTGPDVHRGPGPSTGRRWWPRSTCRCRPSPWPRKPDPDAYLESVRKATVATGGAHLRGPLRRALAGPGQPSRS